jgi:hypothetical protein
MTMKRWKMPAVTGLIAGGLVVAGVALWMLVAKPLLIVAGIGAFGPGILRELGWLRDRDEFQREAAYRAGYHAYLVGGLAAVLIVSGLDWESSSQSGGSEWVALVLVVMWLSWMFSGLTAYWGARRTASRVLLTFGSFWAVFAIATIASEAAARTGGLTETLVGVLAAISIVGPFFVLAWTAQRWPRVTGVILIGVSVVFVSRFWSSNQQLSTTLLTNTLLTVPLIASGLGLLREDGSMEGNDDATPAGVPA